LWMLLSGLLLIGLVAWFSSGQLSQ
jgi:hypothetical protein